MRYRKLRLIAAIVLSAAAWLVLVAADLPQRASYTGQFISGLGYTAPEIGALAPPIRVVTLTNDVFDSQLMRDQTLIINFWATWCIPCELELPMLQRMTEGRDDVAVLAVNVGEDTATVKQWLAARDLTLPTTLDPQLDITRCYQIRGQPTTYIIAPDGRITHLFFGIVSEDTLNAALPSPDG